MAKRKDSLFDDLMVLPWWVAATLAVVAFIALRFVLPDQDVTNHFFRGIASASPTLAPMASGFFGLAALASAARAWHRRRLLDTQSSIDDIRKLDWQDFERLVGEAYRREGFAVHERGLGGADGGVDLDLRRGNEHILVQCKHWQTWKVGVKPIRELYGVMAAEKASAGIFVASGRYTSEAMAFARGKPLTLVDGEALQRLVYSVRQGPDRVSSDVLKLNLGSFIIPLLIVLGSVGVMFSGSKVRPAVAHATAVDATTPRTTKTSSTQDAPVAHLSRTQVDRSALVRRARAVFDAQYQQPEGCDRWASDNAMVKCVNHRMRARRTFLASHPEFSVLRETDL